MIDGSYGRIEYHSWTSPAHNFTDLFALFGRIAMSGTLLARGLLLTILAMVETATGKLCQMLIFIRHSVLLEMMMAI